MDWQPIETAPKDGRQILLCSDYVFADEGVPAMWVGHWRVHDHLAWCFVASWDLEPLPDATHWAPLPPSPGA